MISFRDCLFPWLIAGLSLVAAILAPDEGFRGAWLGLMIFATFGSIVVTAMAVGDWRDRKRHCKIGGQQ